MANKFKYAICNETFQGWDWDSTCTTLRDIGYQYIEVAPFTLAPDVRQLDNTVRQRLKRTAEINDLEIVGLHWLLVSPPGLSLTGDDEATRADTSDYLSALVDFCADLGGHNMILGSPAQRRLPGAFGSRPSDQLACAIERLTSTLSPALDRAVDRGVRICLEPLPAPEADFVLTLQEAVSIVKTINHPSLSSMLDIKSASSEQTPIPELINRYIPFIGHVHVNDANRRGPGFGATDFRPILAALAAVDYEGPVSVEVFDYTPDPVTIATESLKYLKSVEPEE